MWYYIIYIIIGTVYIVRDAKKHKDCYYVKEIPKLVVIIHFWFIGAFIDIIDSEFWNKIKNKRIL